MQAKPWTQKELPRSKTLFQGSGGAKATAWRHPPSLTDCFPSTERKAPSNQQKEGAFLDSSSSRIPPWPPSKSQAEKIQKYILLNIYKYIFYKHLLQPFLRQKTRWIFKIKRNKVILEIEFQNNCFERLQSFETTPYWLRNKGGIYLQNWINKKES